jgi:hypothetical protein
MLVGERLNVLLLDEAALGGLLEQSLDRREVVQMNRVAQCYSFRSWWAAGLAPRRRNTASLRRRHPTEL